MTNERPEPVGSGLCSRSPARQRWMEIGPLGSVVEHGVSPSA
jgi:hypothetical protein